MNRILYNKSGIGLHLSDKALDYFKAIGISDPEDLPRHDSELLAAFDVLKASMSTGELEAFSTTANMYTIRTMGDYEEVEVTTKHWIVIPHEVSESAPIPAGIINEG